MGFFLNKEAAPAATFSAEKGADSTPSTNTPATRSIASGDESPVPVVQTQQHEPKLTVLAILLGAIASMGGFIFGYESGQISGTSFLFPSSLRSQKLTYWCFQVSSPCPTSSRASAKRASSALSAKVPSSASSASAP
jgi:hypothetical protein